MVQRVDGSGEWEVSQLLFAEDSAGGGFGGKTKTSGY